MHSEENKALIHQWMEAWRNRDVAMLPTLFAEDYTVNGMSVGVSGVVQAVESFHSALVDLSAELNELIAEGDKVVARWTVRGKQVGEFLGVDPIGNRRVELTGINIYTVINGRIKSNNEQTNALEVIQDLQRVG
jgi:steroid delta-isomerase-like uncharacterized protein